MKIKRIAAVLSAALALSAVGIRNDVQAKYDTTVGGNTTTTFDKYMVMSKDSHVLDCEFDFTIEPMPEPKSSVPGVYLDADTSNGTQEVLVGIVGTDTPAPVFMNNDEAHTGSNDRGKVVFTHSDVTYNEEAPRSGDMPDFVTTGEGKGDDEKYAQKMLTLEFEDVPFDEPGIYRYLITENGSVAGVSNDPEKYRTLDVYVINDESVSDHALKIANYVMYSGLVTGAPRTETASSNPEDLLVKDAVKDDSYTNTLATRNLSFGKEVTGNQGSKDKYFKFTVKISKAVGATLNVMFKDTEFDVATTKTSATKYDKADMDAANDRDDVDNTILSGHQLKADATGNIECTYYLRDGQYLTLEGLPAGAEYVIEEVPEDYVQTSGTNKTAYTGKTYDDLPYGTIADMNIYTGFTNDRTGAIPTGVLLSVAAPAGIGICVLAGIIFLAIKRSKKDDDDEE